MNEPIDNSGERPEECEACGFSTDKLKAYKASTMNHAWNCTHKWLCKLCAGTLAGQALEYPHFYPNGDVLKAICYVGNVILSKLSEGQN